MLTLSLLRHAKSSWSNPDLDDFDRPLTKRGTKAASEIAKFMRKEQLRPDLVLCSTAVRTRATLALLIAASGPPPPKIVYEDDLYLASAQTILRHVQAVPASHTHVLIVGHNPGLHALALELVGSGERKMLQTLAQEFPTGGLATFSFSVPSFADIQAASGALRHYVTPRRLGSD